jgi:hypothetical protein
MDSVPSTGKQQQQQQNLQKMRFRMTLEAKYSMDLVSSKMYFVKYSNMARHGGSCL